MSEVFIDFPVDGIKSSLSMKIKISTSFGDKTVKIRKKDFVNVLNSYEKQRSLLLTKRKDNIAKMFQKHKTNK